jgi:hypothetical protein
MRILEDELIEQERRNALDPQRRQGYERIREKELTEWRELERELGR